MKTFREAFIEYRARSGWSIKHVAEIAEVSDEQLKKLHQGATRSTNVDDAVKVAHAFGVTLDEFLGDDFAADRDETVSLWLQLSEQERNLIRAASRGLRVEDHELG